MRRQKNRGSATVEITLIIPIVLMVNVLCITMILSAFEQAKEHMCLVEYSEQEILLDKTDFKNWEKENCKQEMKQRKNGDLNIYYVDGMTQFMQGYGITYSIDQRVRNSNSIKNIRRWQLLGDIVSE